MPGQGAIVGVGAMEYPAEFQGAAERDASPGWPSARSVTLTSTYDHRIIQGAAVRRVPAHASTSCCSARTASTTRSSPRCGSPTSRSAGSRDIPAGHEDDITKTARVHELIHAYRVRGHLMADTDPLEYRQRKHPDLDINQHGLTLWDLDREFADRRLRRQAADEAARRSSACCATRTAAPSASSTCTSRTPRSARWIQERVERHARASRPRRADAHPVAGSTWPRRSRRSCRPSTSARSGSRSRAPSPLIPLLDAVLDRGRRARPRRGRHRHGRTAAG